MTPPRRFVWWIAIFLILLGLLPFLLPPFRYMTRYAELLLQEPPRSLPVPVKGVKRSGLVDTWGAARSGGRRHEGIDIFARRNTPVLSATSGIVLRSGWNRLGGRYIMVMGPGGYRHYYAHLEKFSGHEEGDMVEVGDLIGYVGDSGNAKGTPTHLHYGMYKFAGGAINPYPFLAVRRAPSARGKS